MRGLRFVTVILTAVLAAACASDRRTARTTPPTGYVSMTKTHPFGVAHHDRGDGWTEIFVRLNESSSRERARDMAYYYAARLGQSRKAKSLYVLDEKAEMYCHVTVNKGPGLFIIGNPIAMAASIAASAASMASTMSEDFDAFPIHLLFVSLSPSTRDSEGMVRVSLNEVLTALRPKFEPAKPALVEASATDPDSAKDGTKKVNEDRFTEADRQQWVNNAEANVAVCRERYERQKRMKKAARKGTPESAVPADAPEPDESAAADKAGESGEPAEKAATGASQPSGESGTDSAGTPEEETRPE